MKIKSISINGVGGIKHLELNFNPGMNLICGTNGIGKTTILECISHSCINGGSNKLKRNVDYLEGSVMLNLINEKEETVTYKVKDFDPDKTNYIHVDTSISMHIFYFTPIRNFDYIKLENLCRDPERKDYNTSRMVYDGISPNDIKSWFILRYMWSRGEQDLNQKQLKNIDTARKLFSILDKSVTFSRVIPDTFDIMLNTAQGEIVFEYLSSGYKSCIYILFGIIKEIEFRYKNPYIEIEEFNGIILIDEIDVHLHPQWQAIFMKALKELLPNAQIIATTHSPTIVQSAEKNEIIPLYYDEQNRIQIRELPNNDFGYQGWTIEEILKYVMGIEETTTSIYKETLKNFDKAIDEENISEIKANYEKLDKMLHPDNYLRKILNIQMAGLVGDLDDKN